MRRGRTLVNVLLPAAVLVLALLFRILYICAILSSVGFRHSDKDVSHPKDFDQNFISSFGTRFNLRKRQISSNRPLRFLWGIMTTESDLDRRQRQAIRDTYLSYYKSDKENKHRICSITDLINDRIPGDFCQIAYTFVVGAKPDGNPGLLEPFVDQDFNEELTTMPVDLSAVEDDVTYLNIKENMNKGKMLSWFKYATTLELDYDYIAKVDSDTILFPPRFLSFAEENLPNHPLKEQVYGGNPIDSLACGKRWWCKRRIMGKTYMAGGLYFLSANLARYIVSPGLKRDGKLAPREDVATGNLVHTSPNPVSNIYIMNRHKLWEHGEHLKDPEEYEKRWKEVQDNWFGEGIPTTASLEPDQAREPEYYQEPEQSEEPDQEVAHDSSSDVSTEIFNDDHLGDIFSTDISTDDDISIDVAQDSEQPDEAPPRASGKGRFKITTDAEVLEKISALLKKVPAKRQEDPFPTNKYPKVRFLWGIFTTEDGFERRKLIRNTYLSVFNATSTPERICGLNDLLKNRLSHPDECQIVYTFVIGGAHDTNVTDLVFNYTEPLRPLTIDGKEDDVIYLNILENMNKGKSQSWLAYAAHLHQQDNNFSFDYVAKVDEDTLVNLPKFLEFTELTLSPTAQRIYGGVPIYKCGHKRPWDCRQPYGETYMSGGLYFLSADLAYFITTLTDKPHLVLEHEDLTIGNMVNEHPLPIVMIPFYQNHEMWEHGRKLKPSTRFSRKWRAQRKLLRQNPQWYKTLQTREIK